jgi:23S rRNA pseudouridine2605 synthase
MHPRYEVAKIYVVQTATAITDDQLEQLKRGVVLEDGPLKPRNVGLLEGDGRTKIAIEIHEGRNRIIRRAIAALGHEVVSLDRTTYGGLKVSDLRRGKWRRLTEKEIARLRRTAGLKSS